MKYLIKSCRPISVLNTDIKLISKALTRRIKKAFTFINLA